jgi:hypothetical protein
MFSEFLLRLARRHAVTGFSYRIAVRNVDWGNILLQVYCVNWSILLYSCSIGDCSLGSPRRRARAWRRSHAGLVQQKGGRPTTQRAHASAAPNTKPDYDLHSGPAVYVHIFTNAKVAISTCKHVCTQLTCRCAASNNLVRVHAFTETTEAVVRA